MTSFDLGVLNLKKNKTFEQRKTLNFYMGVGEDKLKFYDYY